MTHINISHIKEFRKIPVAAPAFSISSQEINLDTEKMLTGTRVSCLNRALPFNDLYKVATFVYDLYIYICVCAGVLHIVCSYLWQAFFGEPQ